MIAAAAPTKVIERQVKRFIAACPVLDDRQADCAFADRKTPTLHPTVASAEVESARHIRDVHRNRLSKAVTATRRRSVVDETVELA